VQQFVTSVCGAAGAWLAGVLADAGGGFAVTFAAIAVLQLAAAGALRWQSSAARDAEAPPEAS
jgi:predicted MFS family arabinose efflux permease